MVGLIGLPMLQNRPQETWNEVNSMPTHRHDFGVIWTNMAKLTDRECCRTTELALYTCLSSVIYCESLLWLFLFLLYPP